MLNFEDSTKVGQKKSETEREIHVRRATATTGIQSGNMGNWNGNRELNWQWGSDPVIKNTIAYPS